MLGHDKAARAYRPRESPVIIDCAHYRDGRRQEEGPVSLEDAAARTKQGGFVWLGLFEPDPEEFEEVRSAFSLHELAVEDAQIEHMRPKVELYGGEGRLVVFRTTPHHDAEGGGGVGVIRGFLAPTLPLTPRPCAATALRGGRPTAPRRR